VAVNTTISIKGSSDFVPSWQQSPRKVQILLGRRWKNGPVLQLSVIFLVICCFESTLLLSPARVL